MRVVSVRRQRHLCMPFARGQPFKAGAHHQVDDFCVRILAALLEEPHHRIARAGKQGVQHHQRRQRRVDKALRLRFGDPLPDLVTHGHQPVQVVLVGHEHRPQAGVAAGQQRHFVGDQPLQRPAHQVSQLVLGRHVCGQGVEVGTHTPKNLDHGGAAQVFLAGEMLVKAGLGDAHRVGDIVHRHRIERLFAQQAASGLQNGVFTRQVHLFLEGDLGFQRLHARILYALVPKQLNSCTTTTSFTFQSHPERLGALRTLCTNALRGPGA